jgi:hypothetical protein
MKLIVQYVQFRSALIANGTGFGSTKHEQGLIVVCTCVLQFYVETLFRGSWAALWAAGTAARGAVIEQEALAAVLFAEST